MDTFGFSCYQRGMKTKIAPARTVTFEELRDHLKAQHGIDVYDVNGAMNAFDRWCRRHKIPLSEARGGTPRSQDIFTQYIEAPDGQDAEPLYFDFWHFLLEVAREMSIKFKTTDSCHKITIPLPTVEIAQRMIVKQNRVGVEIAEMYRDAGIDPRRAGVGKASYEGAIDVLAKIEADFGRPLNIFAEHSR